MLSTAAEKSTRPGAAPWAYLPTGALFALAMLMGACAPQLPMLQEGSEAPLPSASYFAAAREGARVFRIVPGESLLLVHVGRDGAMKKLGHDHAVASVDVQGFVELNDDPDASRADLAFPLRNLVVDDAAHRARLGLGTGPSAEDIAGTYSNMIKMLQPDAHPWVIASARIATNDPASHALAVSIELNGTALEFLLPVEFSANDDRITVSGNAAITQSEFGLLPFQAAGGLLRVADRLDISFSFVGQAIAGH